MSETARQKAILEAAKKRWAQYKEADAAQIRREREDLSFYEGEGQWPEEIKLLREGRNAQNQNSPLPPVPARPCLTINKTREPIRHVVNAIRQADLGVSIVPADDFPDTGTIDHSEIELREGLVRRIQRESEAVDARMWAADRAVKAGRGYYGLMTRYVSGKSMDQEVYYRRFYDQSCVALDPAHEQPDGADAEWAFVTTKMSWSEYTALYPKDAADHPNGTIEWGESDWGGLCDSLPDWFSGDKETRQVMVREHWYTVRETRMLYQSPDGALVWWDELDKGIETKGWPSRKVIEKRIKFCKTDGRSVLEETDWPSKYIPIIKIVGEEIQPFDDQRRAEGMVRPAREPGQGFNYMVSAMVETIGLAPRAPYVGVAGQFEGFETAWDQANVRNIGRLEYNASVDSAPGQILGPPQRQVVEPPIQAISQAVQMFDAAIKSTTGIPDPTLGNVDPSIRSGKAIKTLLQQAQMGSSNYLDNVVVAAKHEGLVLNSLLAPIYGRPGRIVRMMDPEGETSLALMGVPFVQEGEGDEKRPVPFDPARHQGQKPTVYRLTEDADWNIAIKVSKNYDTRREEQLAQVTDIVNNAPEAMIPVMGDLLFKYDDGPASKELSERLKLVLAPNIQQALQGQKAIPPEVQQQMATMQQALEQTQAQLAQASQVIQTKQVEQQARIEVAKIDADTKLKIAWLTAQSKAAETEVKVNLEGAQMAVDALQKEADRQLQMATQQMQMERSDYMAAQNGQKEDA